MRKFCLVMFLIFGVLAIVLYIDSIKEVDGFGKVANVQGTVFCAGCVVLSVINLVASFILASHEDLMTAVQELKKEIGKNADYNPPIRKGTVSNRPKAEADNVTKVDRSAQKSADPKWIDDGEGFVRCPECNERMSMDFIRARKVCPGCGCKYSA